MNTAATSFKYYSLEAYQELEHTSGQKHNYYDGEVYAMAGGTIEHGLLSGEIYGLLRDGLKGKEGCVALTSEVKIFLERFNSYVYPDASVVCGPMEQPDQPVGAVKNPLVIVEVFSESSEGEDRGEKFRKYRSLPSLQHYVLIAQDKPLVEIWHRRPGQELWRIDTHEGYEARFAIQALELELSVAELYSTVRPLLEANH